MGTPIRWMLLVGVGMVSVAVGVLAAFIVDALEDEPADPITVFSVPPDPSVPSVASLTTTQATARTTLAPLTTGVTTTPTSSPDPVDTTVEPQADAGPVVEPVVFDFPAGPAEEPPAGVPTQFDAFLGADAGPCENADQPPHFSPAGYDGGFVYVGHPVTLCIDGFIAGSPIEVDILDPDGGAERWAVTLVGPEQTETDGHLPRAVTDNRLPAVAGGEIDWTPLPGVPLGEYRIMARQGGTTTVARFLVDIPPAGTVSTVEFFPTANRVVEFVLAGFEGGTRVTTVLYRRPETQWLFVAALPPIELSARGEALFQLRLEGVAPGWYCVVTAEDAPSGLVDDPCLPSRFVIP